MDRSGGRSDAGTVTTTSPEHQARSDAATLIPGRDAPGSPTAQQGAPLTPGAPFGPPADGSAAPGSHRRRHEELRLGQLQLQAPGSRPLRPNSCVSAIRRAEELLLLQGGAPH
jgi:hypothetical protein